MHTPARTFVTLLTIIGVALATATGAAWASFNKTASAAHSVSTATLAAPTGLAATSSASLSWTATTSSWAAGTRIYRATASGGPYSQIAQITGLATTSYVDNPGTGTFYYIVRAYYGANWTSGTSNEATATVGAITLVQSAKGGNTNTTFLATFPSTPAAGNLLVAVAATRSNGTMTPPSGWLTAAAPATQTSVPEQAIFYKVAGASESTTVTISTTASGTGTGLQVFEYSGVSALHTTSTPTTGSTNPASTGNATTTTGRALLVAGVVSKQGASAGAWGNSFNQRNAFTGGSGGGLTVFGGADRIVNVTGTYSTTATITGAGAPGDWRSQLAVFV
jgi:hypothetical protein